MTIGVTVDVSRAIPKMDSIMKEVASKNQEAASQSISKIGYAIEKKIKDEAKPHRVTGGYMRSIRFLKLSKLSGVVYSSLKIARYLEEGTKKRLIMVRNKTVLRYRSHGVTRFSKWVLHPGNPDYRIFEKGVEAAKGDVDKLLESAYKGAGL